MDRSASNDHLAYKHRSNARSAPTTPIKAKRGDTPESYFSDKDRYSSDSAPTTWSPPGTVRSAPPTRRPLRTGFSSEQIHRISRVLEDLEMDFTGKVTPGEAFSDIAEGMDENSEETVDPRFLPSRPSSARPTTPAALLQEVVTAAEPIARERTPTLKEPPSSPFPRSPGGSFPESPVASLDPPLDITPTGTMSAAPDRPSSRSASEQSTPYQIFKDMFPSPSLSPEHDRDGGHHRTSPSEDTTDASTAPSGLLSSQFTSLNRSSTTSTGSTGSSYCADLGYESDDPLERKTVASVDPFEFDSFEGLGASVEGSLVEADLLQGRESVLGGLKISDVAYIQQELVRTASRRREAEAEGASTAGVAVEAIDTEPKLEAVPTAETPRALQPTPPPTEDSKEELATDHRMSMSDQEQHTPALVEGLASPTTSAESHGSFPPTPIDISTPVVTPSAERKAAPGGWF
jgi:hypothetical protein